jgi:uncharacterized protein with FMN-binding domain
MKKKRTGLRILLGILIGIAVVFGGLMAFVLLGKEASIALAIENVPLDNVSDGVYAGSYNGFRFSNTVEVTVKDHEITDISITKPQVFMKEETADELIGRIKEQQSIDVDVVSSATADSNAFLSAVGNALESLPQ